MSANGIAGKSTFPLTLDDLLTLVETAASTYTAAMNEHGDEIIAISADGRAILRANNAAELGAMEKLRDACVVMKWVAVRVLVTYGVPNASRDFESRAPRRHTGDELADEIELFSEIFDASMSAETLQRRAAMDTTTIERIRESMKDEVATYRRLKNAGNTLAAVTARLIQIHERSERGG